MEDILGSVSSNSTRHEASNSERCSSKNWKEEAEKAQEFEEEGEGDVDVEQEEETGEADGYSEEEEENEEELWRFGEGGRRSKIWRW